MFIYVNGCSHTAENIIFNDDSSPFIINTWAGLVLSKFVNKQGVLINDARNGAGNDHIFHTTLETLSEKIRENDRPDYVIIQWSGPNRRTHCDEDGKLLLVNLYDHTQYYVKFEPMATLHTIHYMHSLQEFLKQHKINYYFIPYMGLDKSVENSSIFDLIDMDRVIDFDMGKDIFFDGAIKYILENGLNRDQQGHPSELGYTEIAKRVINHISKGIIKNIL